MICMIVWQLLSQPARHTSSLELQCWWTLPSGSTFSFLFRHNVTSERINSIRMSFKRGNVSTTLSLTFKKPYQIVQVKVVLTSRKTNKVSSEQNCMSSMQWLQSLQSWLVFFILTTAKNNVECSWFQLSNMKISCTKFMPMMIC